MSCQASTCYISFNHSKLASNSNWLQPRICAIDLVEKPFRDSKAILLGTLNTHQVSSAYSGLVFTWKGIVIA